MQLAVGHTFSFTMRFWLLMWLVLQTSWPIFLAFPCTNEESNLLKVPVLELVCLSNQCDHTKKTHALFSSTFYMLFFWCWCSIVIADGRVQPCSLWFLEVYATLEGWYFTLYTVLIQLHIHIYVHLHITNTSLLLHIDCKDVFNCSQRLIGAVNGTLVLGIIISFAGLVVICSLHFRNYMLPFGLLQGLLTYSKWPVCCVWYGYLS